MALQSGFLNASSILRGLGGTTQGVTGGGPGLDEGGADLGVLARRCGLLRHRGELREGVELLGRRIELNRTCSALTPASRSSITANFFRRRADRTRRGRRSTAIRTRNTGDARECSAEEESSPQRHRDSEKNTERRHQAEVEDQLLLPTSLLVFSAVVFSVSPCLRGEDSLLNLRQPPRRLERLGQLRRRPCRRPGPCPACRRLCRRPPSPPADQLAGLHALLRPGRPSPPPAAAPCRRRPSRAR